MTTFQNWPGRALLAFTASLMISLSAIAAPLKPNVIVVLVDDMGWSNLGCYGGEIPTLHLDTLARTWAASQPRGCCWRRRLSPRPFEQLFALSADPQEVKDLAPDAKHAKTLSALRDRCDAYRKSSQ